MPTLYIPRPGDLIRLTEDWSFGLYNEHRNETLIRHLGLEFTWDWRQRNDAPLCTATIPRGSVLKIDRVYVRKGSPDWDSVTFVWMGQRLPARIEDNGYRQVRKPAQQVRFWAKLDETRTMEFEPENAMQ